MGWLARAYSLLGALALVAAYRYERCELARDFLRFGIPEQQLAIWVCIAYHESRFDTAAVNRFSKDYGVLQISELYWCGPTGPNVCGVPCSNFLDDDVEDDVHCALRIFEDHTGLHGDGFLAWVQYSHCRDHHVKKYLADCGDPRKNITEARPKPPRKPHAYNTTYVKNIDQLQLPVFQDANREVAVQTADQRNKPPNIDIDALKPPVWNRIESGQKTSTTRKPIIEKSGTQTTEIERSKATQTDKAVTVIDSKPGLTVKFQEPTFKNILLQNPFLSPRNVSIAQSVATFTDVLAYNPTRSTVINEVIQPSPTRPSSLLPSQSKSTHTNTHSVISRMNASNFITEDVASFTTASTHQPSTSRSSSTTSILEWFLQDRRSTTSESYNSKRPVQQIPTSTVRSNIVPKSSRLGSSTGTTNRTYTHVKSSTPSVPNEMTVRPSTTESIFDFYLRQRRPSNNNINSQLQVNEPTTKVIDNGRISLPSNKIKPVELPATPSTTTSRNSLLDMYFRYKTPSNTNTQPPEKNKPISSSLLGNYNSSTISKLDIIQILTTTTPRSTTTTFDFKLRQRRPPNENLSSHLPLKEAPSHVMNSYLVSRVENERTRYLKKSQQAPPLTIPDPYLMSRNPNTSSKLLKNEQAPSLPVENPYLISVAENQSSGLFEKVRQPSLSAASAFVSPTHNSKFPNREKPASPVRMDRTEQTSPRTVSTTSVFDLYLRPTRPTLATYKFAPFTGIRYRYQIFYDGSTTPYTPVVKYVDLETVKNTPESEGAGSNRYLKKRGDPDTVT